MNSRPTPHRPALAKQQAAPLLAGALAALLTALPATHAQAQSQPYYVGVSQSLGHESNLYRIGDQQVLPAGLSKADTLSSTALFGGVDQSFGRQRLYGSASLRANRYQGNSKLNNESYGLNLALDWATVNRLSGSISLATSQSLTQFNEINNNTNVVETQRNIDRNQQIDAKLRLGVVTQYTAEANFGLSQRRFSAASYARSEYDQQTASLGLSYRPSGLLTLGAAARMTLVDYPRYRSLGNGSFEPDRLKRSDLDLTAYWQPSGNSSVSVRVSPTHSGYDQSTESDFSGLTGSANWSWQASGKLRIASLLSRDSGQSADAIGQGILRTGTVDFSRTTTALKLAADYQFSAKIALNAAITQASRDLARSFNQNGVAIVERGGDNSATLGLGAKWSPTRSLQLGCDLSAEQRRSSNPALSTTLKANSLSCSGQFVLQ